MQISTEAQPRTAESSKLVGTTERKDHELLTWQLPDGDFLTEVRRGGESLYRSAEQANRGRADLEAERWVDRQAAPPVWASTEVGGWMLEVLDHRKDFSARLTDATTGDEQLGVPDFNGYLHKDQALEDAKKWASAHPLHLLGSAKVASGDGELEWTVSRTVSRGAERWSFEVWGIEHETGERFEGDLLYTTPALAVAAAEKWCRAFRPGEPLPQESIEDTQLRDGEGAMAVVEETRDAHDATQPALPGDQRALPLDAGPPVAAAPADAAAPAPSSALPPALGRDLTEASETAREWLELSMAIGRLEDEIKALKDELKAKNSKRDLLAGKLARGVTALRAGKAPEAYQTRLPLPVPLVDVGAGKGSDEAQAAADRLKPGEEKWTANAVEMTLMVRELEPGRWRAWIQRAVGDSQVMRVNEADTEGFGETRDQAIKACKARAEVYLADCPPGSTVRSPDAGPVADGPRTPPKRGRKPKLKGHKFDDVKAALRGAMNLDEAARTLKVTVPELEEYASAAGFSLSEHLAVDTGKDEAPKAKGRSRRKAGAK